MVLREKIWIVVLALILIGVLGFFLFRPAYSRSVGFTPDGPYYIQEVRHFLTKQECQKIRELSQSRLTKSRVYTSQNDIEDNSVRISEQCWLKDLDDPLLADISRRVATLTGTDIQSQEELQVVKYGEGGFYKPHYDACNKATDDCSRLNKGLGPRHITVIMYLNDDFQGGETYFPNIDTAVKPEEGKLAIFYNVDNEGEILPKSLHGGLSVTGGDKWIANKWIRLTALAHKYP